MYCLFYKTTPKKKKKIKKKFFTRYRILSQISGTWRFISTWCLSIVFNSTPPSPSVVYTRKLAVLVEKATSLLWLCQSQNSYSMLIWVQNIAAQHKVASKNGNPKESEKSEVPNFRINTETQIFQILQIVVISLNPFNVQSFPTLFWD